MLRTTPTTMTTSPSAAGAVGAEIQLLVDGSPDEALVAVSGGVVGNQFVLALERADVPDGHVQLVGDPGVGAPLADPGANLIELRF